MAQNRFYSSTASLSALVSSITNSATTFSLTTATGFPASTPFTLILERGTANEEVITVTSITGTSITCTRGSDGTTAVGHNAGAVVEHGVSARDYTEPQAHIAASSAVHGITGSAVGTTDTQTLANKTLTSPTVGSFVNANHSHAAGSGGGQLSQANTHTSPDTDAATSSLHHTIGTSATQAAPGSHTLATAAHGVAGNLVGTTDTQTLTSKTLTSPTVNTPTVTGGTWTTPAITGGVADASSTLGGVSGTTLAAERTAWQTFAPTLTGITIGNGTVTARYQQVGKITMVVVNVQFGSTTSVTSGMAVGLPVTPRGSDTYVGHGRLANGTGNNVPVTVLASGTSAQLWTPVSSTSTLLVNATGSTPLTLSAAAFFMFSLTYEAA